MAEEKSLSSQSKIVTKCLKLGKEIWLDDRPN